MRKLLGLIALCVAIFTSTLILRTLTVSTQPIIPFPSKPGVGVNGAVVKKLSAAVQVATVSQADYFEAKDFLKFQQLLRQQFPLLHKYSQWEVINKYSLLYHIPGSDLELKPILFLAHYDVVPGGDVSKWKYKPFSGVIRDGFVWGRGTMDDKGALISCMEALDNLLARNFNPKRGIYLAIGHDEETGGQQGAVAIARILRQRNVQAEYILDEGGMVTQGIIPSVSPPVALIGVAEKGYVSYQLTVSAAGGHSSVPPDSTAIGQLSQLIATLEKSPAPAALRSPVSDMFRGLSPYMPWLQKLIFTNLWLFEPLVVKQLSEAASTNAVLRTTTAVTMFNAGVADNVLPTRAKAVVNFRTFPGETSQDVKQRILVLASEMALDVELRPYSQINEASSISSADAVGFQQIKRSIQQTDSSIIVVPSLTVAGTDSKHYNKISENIYRFRFNWIGKADVKRYHGIDERVSEQQLQQAVQFYTTLLSFD